MADGAKKKINPGASSPNANAARAGHGPASPNFQIAGVNSPQGSPAPAGKLRSPIAGGIHQTPPLQGGGNPLDQPLEQRPPSDGQTVVKNPESLTSPATSIIDGLNEKSGHLSRTNYIQNKDVMNAEARTRKRIIRLSIFLADLRHHRQLFSVSRD